MGMTLAELDRRMSTFELELRLALAMQKSQECPSCGLEAKEAFTEGYMTVKVKCPACKHEWQRLTNNTKVLSTVKEGAKVKN